MPRSTHCCACFTVRTGTLILGWLGFLGSLMGLLSYSFAKANEDTIREFMNKALEESRDQITEEQAEQMETYLQVMSPVITAVIIYCAVMVLMNGILLIGVLKKKSALMAPWLAVNFVLLILNLVLTIGVPIMDGRGIEIIISNIVSAIIGTLIGFYIWKCVYNHYLDVKEGPTVGNQGYFEPIQNQEPPQELQYQQAPPKYSEKA